MTVSLNGMTSAERRLDVESGVGTVPVDARLTPIAPAQILDVDGGELLPPEDRAPHIPNILQSVFVPAGAAPGGTSYSLTPLSPQGLPGLLPLGFAPAAAFDLRASAAVSGLMTAQLAGLPDLPLHLVEYRFSTHEWHVQASVLDGAGNPGQAASVFNVDTPPPVVTRSRSPAPPRGN